jgi:flavodoxin
MKTLVVYYSRTKITEKVAQTISENINCDIEEIIDLKNRSGAIGYLKAGRDAMRKKETEISISDKDPSKYDCIIIGTPVWAFTMAPAIRTYINQNKNKFKKVAFFCTEGGSGHEKTFKDIGELTKKKPIATMFLFTKDVSKEQHINKTQEFIEKIKEN